MTRRHTCRLTFDPSRRYSIGTTDINIASANEVAPVATAGCGGGVVADFPFHQWLVVFSLSASQARCGVKRKSGKSLSSGVEVEGRGARGMAEGKDGHMTQCTSAN